MVSRKPNLRRERKALSGLEGLLETVGPGVMAEGVGGSWRERVPDSSVSCGGNLHAPRCAGKGNGKQFRAEVYEITRRAPHWRLGRAGRTDGLHAPGHLSAGSISASTLCRTSYEFITSRDSANLRTQLPLSLSLSLCIPSTSEILPSVC